MKLSNTTLALFLLALAALMPDVAFAQGGGDALLDGVVALFTSNGAVFVGLIIASIGLFKWIFGGSGGLAMILGGLVITALPGLFDSGQDAMEQLFSGAGITLRSGGIGR